MFQRRRHGGRQPGIGMMLLAMQLYRVGLNRIPPVTLGGILGQVFIYLNPMRMRIPNISVVCISGVNVWYKEQWQRLLMAPFFHLDEWHLYYNMASFLWKGRDLEKRLGSSYFAYMIGVFAALTSVTTVGLSLLAENVTGDPSYISQCAAGFSGVLFALKVVTTHMSPPGVQRIIGIIPVPTRIACWVELLVIHILVPRSSFVGHLAGILVGLLYVKGPLRLLMDQLHSPKPSYTYTNATTSEPRRNTYHFSGTTGGAARNTSQYARFTPPHLAADYDNDNDSALYASGLSEEDQLRIATEESLSEAYRQQRGGVQPSAPHSDDEAPPPAYGSVTPPAPPPYPTESGSDAMFSPPYPTGANQSNLPMPQAPAAHSPYSGDSSRLPYPPGYDSAHYSNSHPQQQSPNRLYPDLSSARDASSSSRDPRLDDVRLRRLARFDKK